MIKSDYEQLMDRILYGATQKGESKKLQIMASKITKVPETINIPIEYMVGEK